MRSTFGAPLGGTTRGGHQGVESLALSLITPPNFSGGAGSCSPLMVVVALAEAGEPVISWAGVGSATNIAAPAASSDKPFWINFRFIVFCVWVLVYLGIGEKSVSLVDSTGSHLGRADVVGLFSNNVVSFSSNVVLRDPLFSLNLVSKPRMLSVRGDYVLSSLHVGKIDHAPRCLGTA